MNAKKVRFLVVIILLTAITIFSAADLLFSGSVVMEGKGRVTFQEGKNGWHASCCNSNDQVCRFTVHFPEL